jgi:hypothetical protein
MALGKMGQDQKQFNTDATAVRSFMFPKSTSNQDDTETGEKVVHLPNRAKGDVARRA